jgi:hypothetical protein
MYKRRKIAVETMISGEKNTKTASRAGILAGT